MQARYDQIGLNYAELRRPDPRIGARIVQALGQARTIVNIGAGAGSYEPSDRQVLAVEPSIEMIRKRPPNAAPVVQASADRLPFAEKSLDAAMAILTIHHWPEKQACLEEIRRITRGPIVLLTFDPAARPWLTDYFPQLIALDEAQMPAMADYARWLGSVWIEPVPVPHDCSDGFLYAYWARPQAYLDARIRSGSSAFWSLDNVESGLERLRDDLESGAWERAYGHLLQHPEYDAGYRLVIAD